MELKKLHESPISYEQVQQDPIVEDKHLFSTSVLGALPNDQESGQLLNPETLRYKERYSGWRGGTLSAVSTASLILLVNIILAICIGTVWTGDNGVATAYEGSCTTSNRLALWIHLVINVLSSLLLGASNYCMQRLAAPTRKEVNKSHAQQKWMDVGIPSVKNLLMIEKRRVAMWCLLALSSIPLHFLYNSIAFQTIAANDVSFAVVTENFLTNQSSWQPAADATPEQIKRVIALNNYTGLIPYISDIQKTLLDGQYENRSVWQNLTVSECKSRYNAPFVTEGGLGLAVLDRSYLPDSNVSLQFVGESSGFMNNDYARDTSLPILIVVIIANAIKVVLMTMILWFLNKETLVTIGDAIASFLRIPDPATEDCCTMSKSTVDVLWKAPESRREQRWQPRSLGRWSHAVSKRRWIVCIVFYTIAILVAGVLLGRGRSINNGPTGNGLGEANSNFLMGVHLPWADSVIPYVMLANLPQFIISILYLTYNGLWTCMVANREWAQYSIKRAPLRVTMPRGQQRSTYFLQLPYIWSVPLMIASIFLHWIVSQSIFLVRISTWRDGKQIPAEDSFDELASTTDVYTALGWSDIALIISICWGVTLVVAVLVIGAVLRYPKGLPLGGTCSAVISAACHPKHRHGENEGQDGNGVDCDLAEKPIMWGAVVPGDLDDKVGHLAFSSGEVESPIAGARYAGEGISRRIISRSS